jgi:2-keto-4-pentenoate hydratase/2-oxohepta-3-ene-1,7-dioic acid hydratase in catechol pathway
VRWLRFSRGDGVGFGFGFIEGDGVRVCRGDLFGAAEPTGEVVALADVDTRWLIPCVPSQMIALVNNFREAAEKGGLPPPAQPLTFIKAANSFCAHGSTIVPPRSYEGRVLFEGELGVVIGRAGRDIPLGRAAEHVFGYTCVNDVTAVDLLKADPSFPQWTRAKGFDSFGPFGPTIVTGVDPANLSVRTLVNGRERQNYRVADMIFGPLELVSLLSRDVTLLPGDVIACGTSVGAGVLKAGSTVEVAIEGIGTLTNRYGGTE